MNLLRHLASGLSALVCLVSLHAADGPWDNLLEGDATAKWRGFKQAGFPAKGWTLKDGVLHFAKGSGGGDLVTRDEYGSFELEFDWKVTGGANSGVMYRVSEAFDAPWHTGPEYQVLDDAKHGDGKNPKTSAAALYALIAANADKATRPVGEWNSGRIVLRGSQLEHWLNGKRVVATDLASPEFAKLVAGSKFKDMPRFAKEASGRICLQDHGDEVWYRNVRIRRLDADAEDDAPAGKAAKKNAADWSPLFDGKTTAGWRGFGKESFPDKGWVVEDGWLKHVAKGGGGDIITERKFSDFEVRFQWKIAAGGNSGVKYFIDEARKAAIGHEYQLIDDAAHPDAKVGPKRQTAALYDALPAKHPKVKPAGEINRTRIVVKGNKVEHWLNGDKVLSYEIGSDELAQAKAASKFKDEAKWGTKFATPILLQDHGDEVWFRNLRVRELK